MNKTLTATLVAALAAPAFAGGPVLLEDTEVVAERPASNILIPLLAVVAIGLLISSGDDDEPVQPTCTSC
ncbi:hypothetical protein [Tabrizicola sp.]|uniref:hypothetical protein n=1 Tax=Tabrizicola sp. TaxID=2005166 RepID=UPI0025D5F8CF|nr:hypothetical protein [Tabrizicola sp.]